MEGQLSSSETNHKTGEFSSLIDIRTPALVYDEGKFEQLTESWREIQGSANCKLLYAVKAAPPQFILKKLADRVDGFAVSSLFEARLVHRLLGESEVHLTTPGLRPSEISELSAICKFVAVNSRNHLELYGIDLSQKCSVGVRTNTRLSHVEDPRYDPCARGSRLGIPIEELEGTFETSAIKIDGIHLHTNADSTDFGELLSNVRVLVASLPNWVELTWVNLGGGYLLGDSNSEPLVEAVAILNQRFGADVYLEPGAGLVRSCGYLVTEVLDILDVDDERVVVLDTSVNHMPEVLEFGFSPEVMGARRSGEFTYTLAGSSCLAGDVFGSYSFQNPLSIGDRLFIEEAGAYSLTKAHRFNGVNLPNVGVLGQDETYRLIKEFNYSDFEDFWTTNE